MAPLRLSIDMFLLSNKIDWLRQILINGCGIFIPFYLHTHPPSPTPIKIIHTFIYILYIIISIRINKFFPSFQPETMNLRCKANSMKSLQQLNMSCSRKVHTSQLDFFGRRDRLIGRQIETCNDGLKHPQNLSEIIHPPKKTILNHLAN